jgi:flagellar motor protein MotB
MTPLLSGFIANSPRTWRFFRRRDRSALRRQLLGSGPHLLDIRRTQGLRKLLAGCHCWLVQQCLGLATIATRNPRAGAALAIAVTVAIFCTAGCQDNPFARNPAVMRNQVSQLQQEQTLLAQRGQELQSRASSLDRDNQQLESLLAQSRRSEQLINEQLSATKAQLRSMTEQVAQLQASKATAEEKVQTMLASQRRGGVSISPNSSLSQALPNFHRPAVQVRRDGDVVRIAIPEEELYNAGTNQIRSAGTTLLTEVTSELERTYPHQLVGIEGHTAKDPKVAFQPPSHRLSASQAEAVFDYLVNQGRLRPERLFFTSHGSNQPLFSNESPEGRRMNRRVEIVVYPEEAAGI